MPKVRTLDDLLVVPSGGGGGGEAQVKIAETILAASAATINFTDTPQTYSHLELVLFGRGDVAATNVPVLLRMNGDTGANYDYQQLYGNAATASATEALAATSARIGYIPGATAPAGVASGFSATIFDYARTAWQKAAVSANGLKFSTASGGLEVLAIAPFWRSTAAVASLTLYPLSGNFVAGTVASLYGITD